MYKFELICLGLAMSDQAQLIFDSQKRMNFIPLLIPEILDFRESFTIWLFESILDDNSRSKMLPDMEGIWDGKLSIIIIFLSDCFQEHQMIFFSL